MSSPTLYAFSAAWMTSAALLGAGLACGTDSTQASLAGGASQSGTVACVVSTAAQPTCPSPAPSYANQVQDIITNNCQVCHASGGVAAAAGSGGTHTGPGPNNANFEAMGANPNERPAGFDPSTAHDWSVFANIQNSRVSMIQQVYSCQMPPQNASNLSQADRTTLLEWLACNAPNN